MALLSEELASPRASLAVIYGHRRVGKSTLIREAIKAEHRPGLIVVLDEFPYLADADPALPSIVQKLWDSRAADKGNLKLLLGGSIISSDAGSPRRT